MTGVSSSVGGQGRTVAWRGWLAAQVGHRVGALALLATFAGVALMIGGKRGFAAVIACGCGAAAVGLVSSLLARRWGERGVGGLIVFNAVLLIMTMAAMVVARMGWRS